MNSTKIVRHLVPALATVAMVSLIACSSSEDAEESEDDSTPDGSGEQVSVSSEALSGSSALSWFHKHLGSTSYEHYCERAVENSYGTQYHYASAKADYQARSTHHHDLHPPRGALVFWNTSVYYHVGVADGNGGFCSTSVNGRIGCAKLPYFSNYLGWSPSPF